MNQEITEMIMAQRTQALMAGMPEPVVDVGTMDALVAAKTQEIWLELVGDDEPFDRAELFHHLDLKIDVSSNTGDLLQRAQLVANLGTLFIGLGLKVTNADPFGRLLCKIAGQDVDLEQAFSADPETLVQRLAEAAQKNPGSISPEAQMTMVQLGQAAAMQLAASGQVPGQTDGPNAGGPGPQKPGPVSAVPPVAGLPQGQPEPKPGPGMPPGMG